MVVFISHNVAINKYACLNGTREKRKGKGACKKKKYTKLYPMTIISSDNKK